MRPGFFFSIALHALNAALLATLIKKMLPASSRMFAFLCGLAWLLSPFNSEAVVWGATEHYLLVFTFILLCMHYFFEYMHSQTKYAALLVHVFMVLAMLTFEQAIVLPALLFCGYLYFSRGESNAVSLRKVMCTIFLPQVFLVFIYYLIIKIRVGNWVGHYGEKAHFNFGFELIVSNLGRYIFKLSGTHFFYEWRDACACVFRIF